MKEVNIISLTQAAKGLNEIVLNNYFAHFGISPKPIELDDLGLFIQQLQKVNSNSQVFDKFFCGYIIPQISKEFDLLRFGDEYVINIELKSKNTGAKIFAQLQRNHYYLSFLKKKIYCFTFVSSENLLYYLNPEGQLISVSFDDLYKLLVKQKLTEIEDINKLFNPSNYLISPLNSTDEFMETKYFLTSRQEEIKFECNKKLDQRGTTFLSIIGKAGTGKTLLTFDIVKEYHHKKVEVLIIHCGILNAGHNKLRDKYGWNIIPIKNIYSVDFSKYFLVVIDECQRIRTDQLEQIIEQIKINKGNCIFSYDKQQCLRQAEINNDISQLIVNKTASIVFELTEKIRTNKEIASFIISLFDNTHAIEKLNRENVQLSYFKTAKDATDFIHILGDEGWKIINYTQSNRHTYPYDEYHVYNEDNAHSVIGQEFDKVIAVIDHCYFYNGNKLSVKYSLAPYYHPPKMLFQIMTRTRLKLHVVIINNPIILERCLSILGAK